MKKLTEESIKALENALASFNRDRKLEKTLELNSKKVAYSQILKRYLISKGLCNYLGNKTTEQPFLINDMNAIVKDISKFSKKLHGKYKVQEPNAAISETDFISDADLVLELRNRGYDVTCEKTIKL